MRFDCLTVLRGFLALLVVVCHGYERVGWFDGDKSADAVIFSRSGHFGVLCFFVLSGFILTHVYNGRVWNTKEYLINRFARIYPLYIFCLVVVFPIDWFSPSWPKDYRLESLIHCVSLIQSWFEISNARFNGPGWTLSVEFFFYALFPFIFIIVKKSNCFFWVVFFGAAVISVWLSEKDNYFASGRFPPTRLWEFMLGIGLYQVFRSGKSRWLHHYPLAFIFFILVGIVGVPIFEHYGRDIGFLGHIIMVLCGAGIILFLAEYEIKSPRILKWEKGVFIYFGEISFGLYLIHDGVQRYLRVILEYFTGSKIEMMSYSILWLFILSSIVISVISAMILYKFIEVPCRNKIRTVFNK